MKSDDEELKQITMKVSLSFAFLASPISRPSEAIKPILGINFMIVSVSVEMLVDR